jgi:SAM-dependent methyltransferase
MKMHTAAYEYVSQFSIYFPSTVIEIGSRDLNGSVRPLFPAASWTGIDLYPGPSVDIVTNALDYTPESLVDMVICCEVFEHTPNWGEILTHAATWLKPGGRIIITCAGPGRGPHSAIDGGELHPDEHYANISQDQMAEEMHYAGFIQIDVSGNEHWRDTYAIAIREAPPCPL